MTIILNIINAILGIIYFAVPIYSVIWDIFGVIMIITWLVNFGLLYINDQLLIKSDDKGRKINHICYLFTVFYIVAMLLLVGNVGILTITIETNKSAFILPYTLVFIGFFGISFFGITLAYLDIKNLDERGAWKFEN